MKQFFCLAALFLLATSGLSAQKFFTRGGNISFFSATPIEKIEAVNDKATCVVDTESGQMEFAVLIKAFAFEKALMQEHFNENYLESGKFPKATFKGSVDNLKSINLAKDGDYPVTVKGNLTIHGVTNAVETTGTFSVKNGKLAAVSSFEVLTQDYDIEIPAIVRDKIAKSIRIDIAVDLEPLKAK